MKDIDILVAKILLSLLVIDVAHDVLGNVSVIQKAFKKGLVPGAIALIVLILTVFIIFRTIVFVFS